MSTEFGHTCPSCSSVCEAWTDPYGDEAPKPGDAAVCIVCAALMVFTGDDVRLPTPEELAHLLDEQRVVDVIAYVLDAKRVSGGR